MLPFSSQHYSAKIVFDWYIEKLENDISSEAQYALQYFNLQLTKYKSQVMLNTLYSYPIKVTEAEVEQ